MQPLIRAVDSLLQDSRYALRGMRRNPVLAGAVILTLTFGIGLNAGAFAVVSGLVFRARVEKDPDTFFQLINFTGSPFGSSVDDFGAIRSRAQSVTNVAAWTTAGARLNGDARSDLVMLVSSGFFELYGLDRASIGRLFREDECSAPGGSTVAVLSEEIWRDRFHADRHVAGTQLSLSGRAYTVIGVVPAGFSGRLRGPGIWIPYTMQAPFYGGLDLFRASARPWLTVEGRLRPGYSRAQAAAELGTLAAGPLTLTNGSLIEQPAARQAALWATPLFMGALTLLLLLACTNVTVLLLSRAAARRYEISVRLALGAGPGRLLRMAATEGVLLAIVAGGAAAFVAGLVPAAVRSLVPRMPHYPMRTDWVVFSYLAGITLAAGCAAGLAPALESLRGNLSGSLKRQTNWRLRDLLIAAQVAISLVLLVGAALFARTQYRILAAGKTDDARHVMAVQLSRANYERLAPQVRALPGIRSVQFAESSRGTLLARFDGEAADASRAIRELLAGQGVEPRDLPATLATIADETGGRFRSVAGVALFLGFSALVLAVVGVYGVIAFAVNLRMKEIGIRLAFGATRTDIVRTVVRSAARPVIAGLACGLPLAIAGAVALQEAMRKGPAPFVAMDPVAFPSVVAFVVIAAVAAMLRPAARASRLDPMETLRGE